MADRGQPIKVTFSETQMERSKNQATMSFDNLHTISFQLEADRFASQQVRYCTDLEDGAYYGDVWRLDKSGKHYCIRDLTLDGRMETVVFFESMFLPGEIFSPHISNVSMDVQREEVRPAGQEENHGVS